jgi:photosystem II stability/assembly factor-like uncharacterized protein
METHFLLGQQKNGIFRSTDNGDTWFEMNSGLTSMVIPAIAVNGSTVLAGSHGGGVYISTNSGLSWLSINTGLIGYTHKLVVESVALSNNIYLAGLAEDGIFCSTDMGANWTSSYPDSISSLIENGVAINGNILYAGALSGFNNGKILPGGVFISSDNGVSWSPTSLFGNNIDVYTVVVDKETIFASGYPAVYRSKDNGKSWDQINSGLPLKEISPILVINDTLYAAPLYYGGVSDAEPKLYASPNNGDNWFAIESGFPRQQVVATLAFNEKYIFAGGSVGIYKRPR